MSIEQGSIHLNIYSEYSRLLKDESVQQEINRLLQLANIAKRSSEDVPDPELVALSHFNTLLYFLKNKRIYEGGWD